MIRKVTSDGNDAVNLPADAIGAFVPLTDYDIGMFNDFVTEEVDSYFSSSIACCDSCYDDFKAHWPGVVLRDLEFQTMSRDVDTFLSASRMREVYSPAEFSSLSHFIECPRCHESIKWNMWIFEHRFSDVPHIEVAIEQLTTLGNLTPFLTLEHPFSRKVLEQVRSHASSTIPARLPDSLFRARTRESLVARGQRQDELMSFGPAPAEIVGEGRFNHAGTPMLYLGDKARTAAMEIGVKDTEICVAEICLNLPDMKILDLIDLDEDWTSFETLAAIAASALLSAPRAGTGWLKKQYVFSRFVADCARSAGFAAIKYGSTKDPDGANYVLLEPLEDFASLAKLKGLQWLTL